METLRLHWAEDTAQRGEGMNQFQRPVSIEASLHCCSYKQKIQALVSGMPGMLEIRSWLSISWNHMESSCQPLDTGGRLCHSGFGTAAGLKSWWKVGTSIHGWSWSRFDNVDTSGNLLLFANWKSTF